MITILDKVIYGLGALTFVGVSLLIVGFILMFIVAMIVGLTDGLKKDKKQPKSFGG